VNSGGGDSEGFVIGKTRGGYQFSAKNMRGPGGNGEGKKSINMGEKKKGGEPPKI